MAVMHKARNAELKWVRIDELHQARVDDSVSNPSSVHDLGASISRGMFARIVLFGGRKDKNAGDERVTAPQPVPYSPKRGTYAYDHLQKRLKEFDKENKDCVTENDLKIALKSLNLPVSEKEVQDFLGNQGDGSVPFDKFAQYAVDRENTLFDTFKELDKKNTGYLTANELRAALEKYSFRFSEAELQALTKSYSRSGAGPFDRDQLFDFADYTNCLMAFSQKDLRDANEVWGRAIIDVGDVDISLPLSTRKKEVRQNNNKLLRHFVVGTLSSAITRTLVSPLERLKVLSMVKLHPGYDAVKEMKNIWRVEGFQGMLRGNLLNIARLIPTRVTEFFVYEKLKEAVLRKRKQAQITNLDRLLLGSIASMTGSIAGYPLDTLRIALTSQTPNRLVDDLVVKSIMDNGGVSNFFTGLVPNLARVVPYSLITFTVYDQLQERYRKKIGPGGEIGTSVNTLFGILAATAAQTVVHPLEVVQRRLQVEAAQQGPILYANMMNAFQVILEKEGVAGLYSGLPASYAKIIPATAVSLVIYKAIKEKLEETQAQ